MGIVKKIFGSKNKREIKKLQPLIDKIASYEAGLQELSDADLKAKTPAFRQRIDNGETLDDLLPEAYAVVREAAVRALGMRHYDVQMIGGIIMHRGSIAEMRTGEGKTLVATLPSYLNALSGDGVHVVTVNDYLARRDAEWMGKLHNFLGLSVGVIVHGLDDYERQANYRADITYGQNNEFGFDYLRDNMKQSPDRMVQRALNYAIVDEVDSILIDEARTPLIISGPAQESAAFYLEVNRIIPKLKKDIDYTVDEKAHSAMLTDLGVERVQKLLNIDNLYDPKHLAYNHRVSQALRAHSLYKRDKNYLVEEGKIVIVDEHTGRKMPGRRWSDGLHQAIEAKEGVQIEEENQTLATITFQNYFRMYEKLSGMTGTADTEASEFHEIYKLSVSVIPTNKPIARVDGGDLIYKNEASKFKAVIADIKDCHERGQPVLVGTVSVQKSEVVAELLQKAKLPFEVLNAKQHEREALIVAQAGRKGAITISTNMAGRGTDIVLGGNAEELAKAAVAKEMASSNRASDSKKKKNKGDGNDAQASNVDEEALYEKHYRRYKEECDAEKKEVLAAGGLHIIGTERHESRRIDNQLRGRAGRQGDPGSSQFYLSFDDELMRIFIADRFRGLMERLGFEDDTPLEHKWVTKAIENAQKRVEGRNFEQRKNILEYDDVMNQQRKTIYGLRKQILFGQYYPPLTEEQEKAGKKPKPPQTSRDWTIESLSTEIRPQIVEQIDAILDAVDKRREELEQKGEEPDFETWRVLAQEIWRMHGAWIDELRKAVPKGKEVVYDLTVNEVAGSLIQQRERLYDVSDQLIGILIDQHCPPDTGPDDWDIEGLEAALTDMFQTDMALTDVARDENAFAEFAYKRAESRVDERNDELSRAWLMYLFRHFYLEEIDKQWIEHLTTMDHLREGIGLRGYGQKDPKKEYKKEGFELFRDMMDRVITNVGEKVFRVEIKQDEDEIPAAEKQQRRMQESHPSAYGDASDGATSTQGSQPQTIRREKPKVGRNDPCPCGSGKKYKKCHGQPGMQTSV